MAKGIFFPDPDFIKCEQWTSWNKEYLEFNQRKLFDQKEAKRHKQQIKQNDQIHQEQMFALSQQTASIVGSMDGISWQLWSIQGSLSSLNSWVQNINNQLWSVNANLLQIWALLGQWFSFLIEKQWETNNLLEEISRKLEIPDFQKERKYYIWLWVKHYRNAIDNPEKEFLFQDSLNAFLEAENREKTDYFVLLSIAQVYFNAPYEWIYNLEKAEEYIEKAVTYAEAEEKNNDFALQVKLKACYLASQIFYASDKLDKSLKYGLMAFDYSKVVLNDNDRHYALEWGLMASRVYAIENNDMEALNLLWDLFESENMYFPRIASLYDKGEFKWKKTYKTFLSEIRNSYVKAAKETLSTNNSKDDRVVLVLEPLKKDVEKNTFFDSKRVIDEFNRRRLFNLENWVEEELTIKQFNNLEKEAQRNFLQKN